VQQFFPLFLRRGGFYCFYLFMGINCVLAVFTWFCVPETKGVPLEEMDVLFGGVSHVDRGAQLATKRNISAINDPENFAGEGIELVGKTA
jgi:hypothetical protein